MSNDYLPTIAIDAATTTGYALLKSSGNIETGAVTFKGDSAKKLTEFRDWLEERLDDIETGIGQIIYEEPAAYMRYNSLRILFGMRGILVTSAAEFNVPVTFYEPAAVKKHATGKGNAKKPAMLEALLTKPNHCSLWLEKKVDDITDDNEVDAIWMLDKFLHDVGME